METISQNNEIKKAIWKTVAFFDIFDFPLSEFELWQFLPIKCDFAELSSILEKTEKLEKKRGFYFLPGRDEIIRIRQRRYNYADAKFKKTLKVIGLFRLIPWIKMIAIGNIIGPHNLKNESDVDFFIISEKNRIWASRFLCVLIAELFGLRPKKDNFKNKICLSFFVDEDNQSLEKFHLKNLDFDIYFIYWLANLSPVFERGGAYQGLLAKNLWLRDRLPNWQPVNLTDLRKLSALNKRHVKFINFFYDKFEKFTKLLSLKMMNKELKKCQKDATNIIINDGILKLHIKDRRKEIYDIWRQKENV